MSESGGSDMEASCKESQEYAAKITQVLEEYKNTAMQQVEEYRRDGMVQVDKEILASKAESTKKADKISEENAKARQAADDALSGCGGVQGA